MPYSDLLIGMGAGLVCGLAQVWMTGLASSPDKAGWLRGLMIFVKLGIWAAAMVGMVLLSLWALVAFMVAATLSLIISGVVKLRAAKKGD
jgi:hypothetical protein